MRVEVNFTFKTLHECKIGSMIGLLGARALDIGVVLKKQPELILVGILSSEDGLPPYVVAQHGGNDCVYFGEDWVLVAATLDAKSDLTADVRNVPGALSVDRSGNHLFFSGGTNSPMRGTYFDLKEMSVSSGPAYPFITASGWQIWVSEADRDAERKPLVEMGQPIRAVR